MRVYLTGGLQLAGGAWLACKRGQRASGRGHLLPRLLRDSAQAAGPHCPSRGPLLGMRWSRLAGRARCMRVLRTQAAARIVLQDWNDGRIPFFTRPPVRDDHGEAAAAIVPSWGADFDAEAVRGL
jgi:hypothetical protein